MLHLDHSLPNRKRLWNPKATVCIGCKEPVDKSTAVSLRPCSDPGPIVLQPCQGRINIIQNELKKTQDRLKIAQDKHKLSQDKPEMS